MAVLWFPFLLGIDEAGDPKTRPPGTLKSLLNYEWQKDGRLDKRSGTELYSNDVVGDEGDLPETGLVRLIKRGDELCVTDGISLYAWSPTVGAWLNVGAVPEVGLTWRTLADASGGVMTSDSAVLANGALVRAWVPGDPAQPAAGKLYVEIIDPTTGSRILPPLKVDPPNLFVAGHDPDVYRARVLAHGNTIAIIYACATNEIRIAVDGSVSTLRSDSVAHANAAFDATISGNSIYLAYERIVANGNANTNSVAIYKYSVAAPPVQQANTSVPLEVGSNDGGASGPSFQAFSIDVGAADKGWLGYVGNSNVGAGRAAVYTSFAPDLSSIASRVVVSNSAAGVRYLNVGVKRIDATHAHYACTVAAATGVLLFDQPQPEYPGVVRTARVSSTGMVDAKRSCYGAWLLTRPFTLGGRFYTFVADAGLCGGIATGAINSYLIELETASGGAVDTYPQRYVGLVDVLIGGAWGACMPLVPNPGHVSNPMTAASGDVLASLPFQGEVVTETVGLGGAVHSTLRQGERLVTVTAGSRVPRDLWRGVEMQREAHIAGATLTTYDGRRPFDFGFPRPSHVFANNTSNANGSMHAATYLYSVVPTYRSAQGILHRGPAATPISAAVGVSGNASMERLRIVQQTLGWKQTIATALVETQDVQSEIYRTDANGSVLHRLTMAPSYSVSRNVAETSPKTFDDTRNDADIDGSSTAIATRPGIYTIGELDDFPPPAQTTHYVHKNRLWVITGSQREIWVSKDLTENIGTAAGFSPDVRIPFDEDIIGIRSLDDRAIVFAETKVWMANGDGPAVNGDGLYEVVRVQSDVGCDQVRSLVETPDGIMFVGARGLYLLDRGLNVMWIGKAVQDELETYPVVTSAVLVPAKNQVRFTCNTTDGTAGVVLVYDYDRKSWTTFAYSDDSYDSENPFSSVAILDALLFQDEWTFLTANGWIYREDSSTNLDSGLFWVAASGELAEISADGALGYQRVRRAYVLGDQYTACDLTLKVAVNASTSYDQTHTFTSTVLASNADGVNVGRVLKTQKNRSFRLFFTDAAPSGNGAVVGNGRGLNLSAVGFEIEPIAGLERRRKNAVV